MSRCLSLILRLCLFLGAATYIGADLRTNGVPSSVIDLWADAGYTNFDGDTWHFTAWSGSGTGGNFSGGHVYGSLNDGDGCVGGGNICLVEITRIDYTTKANTAIAAINSMTSYGTGATINTASWTDGNTWKSFNPWSWNGNLFWDVYRQDVGPTYYGYHSTLITSPDAGLHWCKQARMAANSYTCNSGAGWQTNGDAPTASTDGMMWDTSAGNSNRMARIMHVQFCQDETCTGMPFGADSYLYFVTTSGDYSFHAAACVSKSVASIMDVTQWWYWKGGNGNCGDTNSWTHTLSSAVSLPVDFSMSYPSSVIYDSVSARFLMTTYFDSSVGTEMFQLQSQYPWGPWHRMTMMAAGLGNFSTTNLAFINRSCSGCTAGQFDTTIVASRSTHHPALSAYLHRVRFSPSGPDDFIGTTQIKVSDATGTGGRVPRNGLLRAWTFDHYNDQPSAVLAAASTYTYDRLDSGTCMAGGSNPAGPFTWTQSGTSHVATLAAGISSGGQYSGQVSSDATGCGSAIPLSGNTAFSLVVVVKPSAITGSTLPLFDLIDPSLTGATWANKQMYGVFNVLGSGGPKIAFSDYGGCYIEATPTMSVGNYYMITVAHAAGTWCPNTNVYLGSTKQVITQNGSGPSNTNLSSSLYFVAGCSGFDNNFAGCRGGVPTSLAEETISTVLIYNRALGNNDVQDIYLALKDSMARRGVTLQ